MQIAKSTRALIVILTPLVLYFSTSVLFVFNQFNLPEGMIRLLHPAGKDLDTYCNSNNCLFNSQQISSLYTAQLLMFIVVCFAFYLLRDRHIRHDRTILTVCGVVIVGALVDYIVGNFSFDRLWIFPNTVDHSPLGIFRYAVLFSVASVCVAILTNPAMSTESQHANR